MKELVVEKENELKRLDVFLVSNLNESRNFILKNIKNGNITVNDNIVKGGYSLKEGDIIKIKDLTIDTSVKAEDIDINILYEDDDIIVVNKKSGMVVHPGNGNYSKTLVNALMYHTDELSDEGGSERYGIVHRIDKDTSGLLIVAKNDFSHLHLAKQIKEHSFYRAYQAVVYGNIKEDKGTVNEPIGRNPKDRKKMAVVYNNSRNAITHYEVIERFGSFTHIKCILETGRTHQIRVHMAYLGHALAGDSVYGPKKVITKLSGQCLHAGEIGFIHPRTNEYLHFTSPLPEYFTNFLAELERKN